MRASLVVNAGSRTGDRAFPELLDLLRDAGVEVESSYRLRNAARVPDTVRALAHAGCDLVILGGGDGTVSSVVDVLAGTRTALGILPLGTANDFARTLEIPADLPQVCSVIASGKIVDVDLGLAGANHYVNVASVGLGVAVSQALSPRLKRAAGPMAYPLAAVKAFRAHESFAARLSFPDGDHETVELERLLQVAVGNGRFYGGGNVVAVGAGIDDRALDVYAIELGRRRNLLGITSRFRSGEFVHRDDVHHYRTTKVLLETEPDLPVNLDGEVESRTPELFTVADNALHVMVPVHTTAARYDAGDAPS
jgi:diacylglycerol kinase (ATP)